MLSETDYHVCKRWQWKTLSKNGKISFAYWKANMVQQMVRSARSRSIFWITAINSFFGTSLSLVLPPTELEDCAVLCWMLPLGCQASEFKSIFEGKTKTRNVCLSWSGFTAKHFVLLTAPFSRAFSSILKSKLPSCKETLQSFNGSFE